MNSNTPVSPCILIADDDTDDLLFFTSALKNAGVEYSIVTFIDGDKVIDHINENKNNKDFCPVLIVCDLNMPKKSGKEVLKMVKTDPQWNEVPFIILSTSANKDDIDECYALGANSYLVKPALLNDMDIIANGIKAIWLDDSLHK